jgi:hypothetical protein
MELNITKFFNEAAPADYSASRMELGQDAGRITWRHACEDAPDFALLDTDGKREAFKAHIRDFGAWSDEEIAAWSDTELNALCVQMISGDMREADIGPDSDAEAWTLYEIAATAGRCTGRIFRGDNGEIYYYLGT